MREDDWTRRANCLNSDPRMFDMTDPNDLWTMMALAKCHTCPVQKECLETVRPAESKFDGVCADRVWVDGKVVWACGDLACGDVLPEHTMREITEGR